MSCAVRSLRGEAGLCLRFALKAWAIAHRLHWRRRCPLAFRDADPVVATLFGITSVVRGSANGPGTRRFAIVWAHSGMCVGRSRAGLGGDGQRECQRCTAHRDSDDRVPPLASALARSRWPGEHLRRLRVGTARPADHGVHTHRSRRPRGPRAPPPRAAKRPRARRRRVIHLSASPLLREHTHTHTGSSHCGG